MERAGIGVAESVNTSTCVRICFSRPVRHAEALLLVNDDEAQVAESDVLRQEPVRADDDVQLAVAQLVDRLADLGGRAEAVEKPIRTG